LEEIEHLSLVDIWCKQHGEKKSYARSTNKYLKKARLDFFLVSEKLANRSETCKLESGYRTDHCMITLSISKGIAKRGNGYWKFITSLLKDLEYSKLVLRTLRQCLDLYAALLYNGENIDQVSRDKIELNISVKLFMDVVLMMIRGETIKYCSARKK